MTAPTADTTEPEQDSGELSRKALEEQFAAINAHDVAGFISFYAEDAVVVDPQYPEPLRGRAAIERDMTDYLTAFPDLSGRLTSRLIDGLVSAAEATMTGTHNGPLALPTGEIPATGRRLEFPMAVFSRLNEDGLIVEERRYYNLASQQEQLGLS
ncbi:nuclear transport factor 2 family protein [Kocuria sp. CPCC 205258]|uniref:ester cyclase n=1 Tax=Kocuria sp. CPCC 205258 TaxID=3073552 RepID=UPI0034D4B600